MPVPDYLAIALVETQRQGLTSSQVNTLGFSEIAALAGVDTKKQNPNFSYENTRGFLVRTLARKETEAAREAKRKKFEQAIKLLPGSSTVSIIVTDEGELKIEGWE